MDIDISHLFKNQLVVQQITSFVSNNDLLNLRLVNRFFEESTKDVVLKRCYLQLESSSVYYGEFSNVAEVFLKFLSNTHGRLLTKTKGVYISTYMVNWDQLLKLVETFEAEIQRLKFEGEADELTKLLNTGFTSIKSLTVDLRGKPASLERINLSPRNTIQNLVVLGDSRINNANYYSHIIDGPSNLRKLVFDFNENGPVPFVGRALEQKARRGELQCLRKLGLSCNLDRDVVHSFFDAAKKNKMSNIRQFEVFQLEVEDSQNLTEFVKFLVHQKEINIMRFKIKYIGNWIPKISCLARNRGLFSQFSALSNLSILEITPMFNMAALQGCSNLITIKFVDLLSKHHYEYTDCTTVIDYLFGNSRNQTFKTVRNLSVNFCFREGDQPGAWVEDILSWFPRLVGLELGPIQPSCLSSIWKCESLCKVKIRIFLDGKCDINLDDLLLGYNLNASNDESASVLNLSALEWFQLHTTKEKFVESAIKLVPKFDVFKRLILTDISLEMGFFKIQTLKHLNLVDGGEYNWLQISERNQDHLQSLCNRKLPGGVDLLELTSFLDEGNACDWFSN